MLAIKAADGIIKDEKIYRKDFREVDVTRSYKLISAIRLVLHMLFPGRENNNVVSVFEVFDDVMTSPWSSM